MVNSKVQSFRNTSTRDRRARWSRIYGTHCDKIRIPMTSVTQTHAPVNGENKIWRINWIIDFTVWCMYYINVLQASSYKNLIIRSFMSQTESLFQRSFQFILQLTENVMCNIVTDLWGPRFEIRFNGSSDWDFPYLYWNTREPMTSTRNLFVCCFIQSIWKIFP